MNNLKFASLKIFTLCELSCNKNNYKLEQMNTINIDLAREKKLQITFTKILTDSHFQRLASGAVSTPVSFSNSSRSLIGICKRTT